MYFNKTALPGVHAIQSHLLISDMDLSVNGHSDAVTVMMLFYVISKIDPSLI